MADIEPEDFSSLYARFKSPIAALNCGHKCAPYNERGVPFCCDTAHMIPTVYLAEWGHLQSSTDLWHRWQSDDLAAAVDLQAQVPEGQLLVACQGHERCQRGFRALTCRAFPFFPYITSGGDFIGLSYYWDYEDRCWVISNLQIVTPEYLGEFISAYETLFDLMPSERENFSRYSNHMRDVFNRKRRSIPLLHRDGSLHKISPRDEHARRVPAGKMPKFGPYKIAAQLTFPEEEDS